MLTRPVGFGQRVGVKVGASVGVIVGVELGVGENAARVVGLGGAFNVAKVAVGVGPGTRAEQPLPKSEEKALRSKRAVRAAVFISSASCAGGNAFCR